MKTRKILILLSVMLLTCSVQAQVPEKIDFQAVARNDNGQLIADQLLSIRFTISQTPSGVNVYQEEHGEVYTDSFGLFTLPIGTGSVLLGNFGEIDWTEGNYIVTIEIDPDGSSNNYINIGSLELMSVPYALYAGRAGYGEDADADSTNELNQGILLDGTDLKISDAGGVLVAGLESLVDDADADPANELNQSLQLTGDTLLLTDANGTLTADLGSLIDDDDADPSNEIQQLMYDGQLLSISSGNAVTLPWAHTGNDIFYNEGNVSIGSNTASGLLDIHDVFYTQPGRLIIRPENELEEGGQMTFLGSGTYNNWHIDNYAGLFRIFQGSINAIRITTNGNVGLGILDAPEKLTVGGNFRIQNEDNSKAFGFNISGDMLENFIADADLEINTYSGSNQYPAIRIDHNTGHVGIGDVDPVASLDVNGSVRIGENGKLFSEIIEVEGQTNSSGGSTSISFPTGYNSSNTRVMSVEIAFGVFGAIPWHTLGYAVSSNSVPIGCIISDSILLSYSDIAGYHNSNYRIMLMKVE